MNRSARIILGVFILVAVFVAYSATHLNHASPPQAGNNPPAIASPAPSASPQTPPSIARPRAAQEQKATVSTAPFAPHARFASASPYNSSAAAASNSTTGFVAVIDPATGKLRQAEASEIGDLVNTPAQGTVPLRTLRAAAPLAAVPQTFVTPSGITGAKVPDDAVSFFVVTKAADGTLTTDCVEGKQAALKKVKAAGKKKLNVKPDAAKEAADEM